ncbi:actin-like ATPase domain-containing protein [Ceraceosorus guamensis]|uniref:Xylulose kinase n=1 Tax=Ceraceosorus guamensis TaxID=1522189 RepID=A0A316VRC1_9BASI|nr:actin-like ATPase domain-containing protein [Ceraceosorus guamensis]PWN40062.1 actin-like ATPase domain-containing protein [Ceraceosorus guamensis]
MVQIASNRAQGAAAGDHGFVLGLDSSTQSFKASLLCSKTLEPISEASIHFDSDLPQYGTSGGVLVSEQGDEVWSPVEMIVHAMDELLDKLRQQRWDLASVKAVSASGQQHATVYWSDASTDLLARLDASRTISSQLQGAFSRSIVPNWQDASTTSQCDSFRRCAFRQARAAGLDTEYTEEAGDEALTRLTGSAAHTRFSGEQIMKFRQRDAEAWKGTHRIGLVSSALSTLLTQTHQGIDESDACGTNLWQLSHRNVDDDDEGCSVAAAAKRHWNVALLQEVAGSQEEAKRLEGMLGEVECDAGRVIGKIGKWFVQRYGFDSECIVCPGTGDNPATFLSFALPPKQAVLSLGTSDTVLLSSDTYNPKVYGHTFVHPALRETDTAELRYMSMLCYKNGSLARQAIRDTLKPPDWDHFNKSVFDARSAGLGLPRRAAFYWLRQEIIPPGARGTVRYELHGSSSHYLQQKQAWSDSDALNILESQFMSYRHRVRQYLSSSTSSNNDAAQSDLTLDAVYLVGGASNNPAIQQLVADVMGCKVYLAQTRGNACSVGAAYKAAWALSRHTAAAASSSDTAAAAAAADKDAAREPFEKFVSRVRRGVVLGSGGGAANARDEQHGASLVAQPDPKWTKVYAKTLDTWIELERRAQSDAARV